MKAAKINMVRLMAIQVLILMCFVSNAQNIKDFDGNVYKTIKYGKQIWASSNLNVTHFRNGDVIAEAKTPQEWEDAGKNGKPVWCHYDNTADNGVKYGKLYNWFAINDPRGLAPSGWHIPANTDWMTLVKNLMGVDVAGIKLKSTTGWKSKPGTNTIGFAAFPSGCIKTDGKFKDMGVVCQWWSNSVPVDSKPSNKIYSILLNDSTPELKYILSEKGSGFSVRCVKD